MAIFDVFRRKKAENGQNVRRLPFIGARIKAQTLDGCLMTSSRLKEVRIANFIQR